MKTLQQFLAEARLTNTAKVKVDEKAFKADKDKATLQAVKDQVSKHAKGLTKLKVLSLQNKYPSGTYTIEVEFFTK